MIDAAQEVAGEHGLAVAHVEAVAAIAAAEGEDRAVAGALPFVSMSAVIENDLFSTFGALPAGSATTPG